MNDLSVTKTCHLETVLVVSIENIKCLFECEINTANEMLMTYPANHESL